MFTRQCNLPGQSCMMLWENTPLPQQGPHCQVPPNSYYPSFSLLSDVTPFPPTQPIQPIQQQVEMYNPGGTGQTGGTGGTGQYSN